MTLRDFLSMILTLTLVSGLSGGLLSAVKTVTNRHIEYQRLQHIMAPALNQALTVDYDNDPIKDRRTFVVGHDQEGRPLKQTVFYATKKSRIQAVAMETSAGGYKDQVGIMLSIDVQDGILGSIAITTHSETPGIGTRVFDHSDFMDQFFGKPLDTDFSSQTSELDAVSGATFTSYAIMDAVNKGLEIYKKYKDKILKGP